MYPLDAEKRIQEYARKVGATRAIRKGKLYTSKTGARTVQLIQEKTHMLLIMDSLKGRIILTREV